METNQMCGIAGILHFQSKLVDQATLEKMTSAIIHRGPDDFGFWCENQIGLGFRRLSIIDLKEGHQPLCNEDESVWIVFNGEIYNYKYLREQLLAKGHQFKTHTDTEVIVHLYEEYGENCVDHLRGMFGFVIWDRRKQQLFGARDHFGIKPFYYYMDDDQFVFGSEIKSIIRSGLVSRQVNQEALYQFMTFQYVPEPLTMFQGIHKLPPGHRIIVHNNGMSKIEKYWDPSFETEEKPFDEYVEELREKLKDSVVHHMQSDVQRGCFLSSGIDSTAIATYMRSIEPIKTFSVGFDGPQNETHIAKETAKALGTDHYAKVITKQDFFASVPNAVWHQDEPVADPSAIALYHVAELARQHVTVVLSGEGADELFGGYRIYREPLALKPLEWLPLPVKRAFHRLLLMAPQGMKGINYLLRGTTPLEERFIGNAKIFQDDLRNQLLQQDLETCAAYRQPLQIAAEFYERTQQLDPVSRMQYIDLNLWLPGDILMKADKMTMSHSLELRVPFLDRELFNVARRIPAKYRIANGTTKYIFRKAMEGIIPDFILNRPKLGFPVPMRDWLKEQSGDMMLEKIKGSGIDEFISIEQAENLLQRHRRGQADYSRHLWVLYIFAMWHERYMLSDLQEFRMEGVSI